MPPAEFMEWVALDSFDPLPDRRGDWQHAALSATVLNSMTRRTDGEPWRPADLLLFGRPEPKAPDREAVARKILGDLRSWNRRRAQDER